MVIGSIIHHKYFNGVISQEKSNKYKTVVGELFSNYGMFGTGLLKMISKENIIPQDENDYNWETVDKMVEYATQNRLSLHYNTVIPSRIESYPDWFKNLGPEEKYKFVLLFVETVVNRYKEKIAFFKLVNEPLLTKKEDFLGTEKDREIVIAAIFKTAKQAFPKGKYMLNDHGLIMRKEKREEYIQTVEAVKKLGAEIDLIGIEGHLGYFPETFRIPPIR